MRHSKRLSRRNLLQACASLAVLGATSGPASALEKTEAANLIGSLVADLSEISRAGVVDQAMLLGVRELLEEYSDIPMIARSSLGVVWRRATDTQKARFIQAYTGYMVRKYSQIFVDYHVNDVAVTSIRKVTSGYVVASSVQISGAGSFFVEWQVVDVRGRVIMANLVVQGISMLATERTEIATMLEQHGNDLDKLIAYLMRFRLA